MKYRVNLFMTWFFIPQTLAMGWVAAVGRIVLELLGGVDTVEGDLPGRIVGALVLFGAVYTFMHVRGSLPPEGKPDGNGFVLGHRLLLAGNILAALLFIFQLTFPLIESRDLHLVLDKFTTAFGYWVMAIWIIGFSLLYQSSLPKKS
jgi:hypothetical protein